jgi:hypothetical protein
LNLDYTYIKNHSFNKKEIVATATILINYNISKLYGDKILFLYIKQSHTGNQTLQYIFSLNFFFTFQGNNYYDFVSILNLLNYSLYSKILFLYVLLIFINNIYIEIKLIDWTKVIRVGDKSLTQEFN